MTVMPPVAAPAAPAAKTPGAGAAGASPGEARAGVAAVFAAMVAAVSDELAAAEQAAPTLDGEVEPAAPDGDARPDEPAAGVPETDEVAQSAMAASLLVTIAPPAAPAGSTDPATGADASVAAVATASPLADDLAGPEAVDDLPAGTDGDALIDAVPEEAEVLLGDLPTTTGPDADADTTVDIEPRTAAPDEPARSVAETSGRDTDADADGPVQRPASATVAAPASATDGAVAAAVPTPGGATAVSATTAASAVDRPAAPALPDQLVEVLAPLRRAPDGTHRMAIQLRPDELGDVHIEFQIRGNEISLNLRAELASTNDLLRESLAQLRAELDAAGFESGTLDVADHGDPRDGAGEGRASDTRHTGDASAEQTSTAARRSTAAAGETRLDLRL